MAAISGTTGTDILFGTDGDDIFTPRGTTVSGESDWMSGGNGADTYQLYRGWDVNNSFIVDDQGNGGATDSITGLGGRSTGEGEQGCGAQQVWNGPVGFHGAEEGDQPEEAQGKQTACDQECPSGWI